MPVAALVDDCPLYALRPERPAGSIYPAPKASLPADASPAQSLLALLACPNIASRRPLFEHYDPVVQSRTVRRPETADAAVLAIQPLGSVAGDGPQPGIAVSIDCNGRRVAADPYRGTIAAVLECAGNLACVGADPLGVTNNLNFGNPEKPHVAWQLESAVRGLGDACRALGTAIVGGNVSLYNESASGPIYPTPVVGMVGALPDVRRAGRMGFAREGDAIALVGAFSPALPASELAKLLGRQLPSELPELNLDAAIAAIVAVKEAVRGGEIASAHDIAEGGLAVALAECCLAGGIGAAVSLPAAEADLLSLLFGEAPSGFLLSGPEDELHKISRTQVQIVGRVGGDRLQIEGALEATLGEMERAHGALAGLFQ
jgi:phosphoribosylformylglycinamidine synthase